MNDFTKEELILINRLVRDSLRANDPFENPFLRDMHRRAIDVSKSMIDNYCEHQDGTTSNSDVDYVLSCSKCNAFKGWV